MSLPSRWLFRTRNAKLASKVRVDIWSDLVCPWCYVGKRRFEKALARFDNRDEVRIVHRSFQLNPAAPRDRASNRRDMLMQKYRLTAVQAASRFWNSRRRPGSIPKKQR